MSFTCLSTRRKSRLKMVPVRGYARLILRLSFPVLLQICFDVCSMTLVCGFMMCARFGDKRNMDTRFSRLSCFQGDSARYSLIRLWPISVGLIMFRFLILVKLLGLRTRTLVCGLRFFVCFCQVSW